MSDFHLMPGDLVKASREAQRMWWQVVEVSGDGPICRLDSEPATHFGFAGEEPDALPIQPTLRQGDRALILWDEILDYHPNPGSGHA